MPRTSHTDWNLERVVRTYWQLTEIEATASRLALRSLKPTPDEKFW